jgi:hypothetical protein
LFRWSFCETQFCQKFPKDCEHWAASAHPTHIKKKYDESRGLAAETLLWRDPEPPNSGGISFLSGIGFDERDFLI